MWTVIVGGLLIFTLNDVNCVPNYIDKCTLGDPDFQKCVLAHASQALPHILKYGSKHFDTPELLPYHLSKGKKPYTLEGPNNFILELSDTDVVGFENTQIKQLKMDLETNKFILVTALHYVAWLGDYQMKGTIFNKPITGNGRTNLTFVDGIYTLTADITTIEIDGKQHFELCNASSDFQNKIVLYQFDGLYGDNEKKGNEMQKKIIEEWETFRNITAPDTKRAIIGCYARVFNDVFRKIPVEDMFIIKEDDNTLKKLHN